jgi:nucleoside-diphosphate-sugar epimerase
MGRQKVFVTGCNGFVGSNLVTALRNQKGIEVVCHDREEYPYNNIEKLRKLLTEVNTIVHIGGLVRGSDFELFEANVNSVVSLLEAAPKNIHFIYSSSFAVYKSQNKQITEKTPTEPRNYYGFTKKLAEEVIRYTCVNSTISATILRFANIYGKNASNSFVWNMHKKIQQGEDITIHGDGTQSRDFIYIDDAVDACIKSIKKHSKNSTMNICSGISYSLNEVIHLLEEENKKAAKVTYNRSAKEKGNWIGSFDNAFKSISWKPKTLFLDGIHNL